MLFYPNLIHSKLGLMPPQSQCLSPKQNPGNASSLSLFVTIISFLFFFFGYVGVHVSTVSFVSVICCFREISTGKSVESNARAFVIRVSDDELENDNERKGEEVHNGSLVAVKRFTCDALYLRYVFLSGPVNLCSLFNNIVALPISYCCGKLMFVSSNDTKCIEGLLLSFSESDDSDDDVTLGGESYLMDEVGLADGALVELTHQHQLGVKVCTL